jgi:hypothetical protein
MRRYCLSTLIGLAGFFLTLFGIFLATRTLNGTERSFGWRVVSAGTILFGLTVFLQPIPDWVPAWGRRFAPIYAWFFIIVGIVIFLLSWL